MTIAYLFVHKMHGISQSEAGHQSVEIVKTAMHQMNDEWVARKTDGQTEKQTNV